MFVREARTSTSWLVVWAVLAIAPIAAYAQPLVRWAVSDNPLAYLVWVPLVAAVWAIDNLRRVAPYRDDEELNALVGGTLALTVAFVLVAGPRLWPYAFTTGYLAFLFLPAWALALGWLWFGVGATRVLIAPLAYLLLAWPPLLSAVANRVEGALLRLDTSALAALVRLPVAWLTLNPHTDVVRVVHGAGVVSLSLGAACSGVDGVLAVAIILPFVLGRAVVRWPAMAALVVTTAGASLLLNLVRMAALVTSLHVWGAGFAMGVVHPVLGPALFVLLALVSVRWAVRWRIVPPDAPPTEDAVALPSSARTLAGLVLAFALGVLLWPVMTGSAGPPETPLRVPSFQPAALFPRLAGFRTIPLGSEHASARLGSGTVGAAVAYANGAGAYVLARLWLGSSATALGGDLPDAGLLFPSDEVRAVHPLSVVPGTLAALYSVALPSGHPGDAPPLYLDMEWTRIVTLGRRTGYLHVALAVPPEAAAAWARQAAGTPLAPPATDAPWLVAAHGTIAPALSPMLPRLVGFGARFANALG